MTCLQREPSRRSEIKPAMLARIHTVLTLGAAHGHTSIILGAWGCGGDQMAAWFDDAFQVGGELASRLARPRFADRA